MHEAFGANWLHKIRLNGQPCLKPLRISSIWFAFVVSPSTIPFFVVKSKKKDRNTNINI